MTKDISQKVVTYIDGNIALFHTSKLEAIRKLDLMKLMKRKNPYLFKAKNIVTSSDFVKSLLEAHLSSQEEETMFGNFLEGLAKVVCNEVFQGNKTPAEGIDLDFSRGGRRYLVSVKSGPNWGNSRATKKMVDDFNKAKRIIGKEDVICVNGCCYGRDLNENKGSYTKKCGQSFWEFVSGDNEFYKKIIEPIGAKAKERNDEFSVEYGKVITRFDKIFIQEFCLVDGSINWNWIVEYNSGINPQVPMTK